MHLSTSGHCELCINGQAQQFTQSCLVRSSLGMSIFECKHFKSSVNARATPSLHLVLATIYLQYIQSMPTLVSSPNCCMGDSE